jgi:hypothetical protein
MAESKRKNKKKQPPKTPPKPNKLHPEKYNKTTP